MVKTLENIRSRLKLNIAIVVRSSPSYYDGKWTVLLETESNNPPYWMRWEGNDIENLLNR